MGERWQRMQEKRSRQVEDLHGGQDEFGRVVFFISSALDHHWTRVYDALSLTQELALGTITLKALAILPPEVPNGILAPRVFFREDGSVFWNWYGDSGNGRGWRFEAELSPNGRVSLLAIFQRSWNTKETLFSLSTDEYNGMETKVEPGDLLPRDKFELTRLVRKLEEALHHEGLKNQGILIPHFILLLQEVASTLPDPSLEELTGPE